MAIMFDRSGLFTSVGLNSPHISNTTFTSARKFIGADTLVDSAPAEEVSNAEHIVDQAAGLKTIAMVADQAAKAALDNVAKIRASLLGNAGVIPSEPVGPKPFFMFNEFDVANAQRITSDDIISRIGPIAPQISRRIHAAAPDIVLHSVGSLLPIREVGHITALYNTAVPEVDHISVELDKKRGTIDCFYARVVFSLPRSKVAAGNIRAVRIFRSTVESPDFMKDRPPLSLHAIERLKTDRNRSRTKNDNSIFAMEQRLRENGIANALTNLIPVDPLRNIRVAAVADNQELNIPPPIIPRIDTRNEQLLSSFVSPELFSHIDRSVITDLKVLRNIQLQNPALVRKDLTSNVHIGRAPAAVISGIGDAALRQLSENTGPRTKLIVDQNNKQEFKEIAFVAPDKLSSTVVGELVTFSFDDETIQYGKGYRYYLLTVDNNMLESVRSRIVEINVDGLRIPECPRRVFASIMEGNVMMNTQVDDLLVEKFEIFRKEADPGLARPEQRPVRLISSDLGFTSTIALRERQRNNFIQIGEALNGMGASGASFFDRTVQRGQKYVYRIYSVDVFGNKSECPYEFAIFVPEPQLKPTELKRPTILVEVDSATNKSKVTIQCDDPRVQGLFLGRRDLTLRQNAFVPPGQVNRIKFGANDHGQGGRRFEDVKLVDHSKDVAWTGYFPNNGQQIVFIDQNVTFDHSYQYRVYGVDRYGNQTSFEYSKNVAIVRRPFINTPLNLSADVQTSGDTVTGVKLTWDDGNLDVSAEDMVGSQEKLEDTAVRTLFQVERRKVGEDRWHEFPLVSETSFVDPTVAAGAPPNFRPEYLQVNQRYVYRVEAVQSGSFISNFSNPVEVFVGFPILAPVEFRARASDTKARPFYVMLNWNTDPSSGVVDKWEIQKAEVNNIAAARLNTRNPADFENLDFKPFREVYLEASRFRSIVSDATTIPVPVGLPFRPVRPVPGVFNPFSRVNQLPIPPKPIAITRGRGTIIGEHHYMDTAVVFGNTYFYRIRAVSPEGTQSDWIYKGVKVTDETFEKKLDSVLTNNERVALSSAKLGMRVKNQSIEPLPPQSMYGYTPPFAQPVPPPKPPPPPVPVFVPPILRPTLPPAAIAINPIPPPPPPITLARPVARPVTPLITIGRVFQEPIRLINKVGDFFRRIF